MIRNCSLSWQHGRPKRDCGPVLFRGEGAKRWYEGPLNPFENVGTVANIQTRYLLVTD